MSSSSLTMPMIILLYNTQSYSLLIWFEMILILAVKFAEAESSLHSIEPLISGLNVFFRSHYCPIVLKTLLALEGLWHLVSMILKTLQHGSYSVAYDNNAISLFFIGTLFFSWKFWNLLTFFLKLIQSILYYILTRMPNLPYLVLFINHACPILTLSCRLAGLVLALYFVLEAIYRRLSRDQNRTQTLEDDNATLQTSLKEE